MRKLALVSILFTFLVSCTLNEGGVTVSNNMEKYALDYIEANGLLEAEEKIIAYYDYTLSLDGTEAIILTDSRLLYHNAETYDTSVLLEDIEDIEHHQEDVVGHIINVYDVDGSILMIEIAPLNNGSTFVELLESRVYGLEEGIL